MSRRPRELFDALGPAGALKSFRRFSACFGLNTVGQYQSCNYFGPWLDLRNDPLILGTEASGTEPMTDVNEIRDLSGSANSMNPR